MATSVRVGRRIARTVGPGVSSSYSNGRTLINRARIAAETSPIRFVIGHGLLEPDVEERRVPANTYVIFLSKPGQLLSSSQATQLYQTSEQYVRSALTGRIRTSQIKPYRLSKWTSHVYGPNDKYPNLRLTLSDSNPELSRIFGMTKLELGSRQFRYGEQRMLLNQFLTRGGPGIYIVAACRSSIERLQLARVASHINSNIRRVRSGSRVNRRGEQRGLRLPSRAPPLNLSVAELERAQKRRAAHKRSGSKLPNSLPAKNVYFSFNPGSTNTGLKKNGKRIFQRSNGVYFIMNGRPLTVVSSNIVNAARRLATRRRSH